MSASPPRPHVLDVRFGSPRPDDLCVCLRAPDGEVVFELREAVDALDSTMLASALEAAIDEAHATGVAALELWLSPPSLVEHLREGGAAFEGGRLSVTETRGWPTRQPQAAWPEGAAGDAAWAEWDALDAVGGGQRVGRA